MYVLDRKKTITAACLTAALTMLLSISVFAAGWHQDGSGWRWYKDDGSVYANEWQWLDGNRDGIAECYYFNASGYCAQNTMTPDHYTVNADGAWTVNGVVQTKQVGGPSTIMQAGSDSSFAAAQAAAAASAAGAPAVSAAQAVSIARYMTCVMDFLPTSSGRLFGTEVNRGSLSYDQIANMTYYYARYIADPRVNNASGPVFVGKEALRSIMKEVYGTSAKPAMDRLLDSGMDLGDQLVFNYRDDVDGYALVEGSVQYAVENGMLKVTAAVEPTRDYAEDGTFVAWFAPNGAAGMYGYRFERIEFKKYR